MGPLASPQAAATLTLVLSLVGCEERPRPWQGRTDGGVADESKPFLPGTRKGPLLGDASFAEPEDGGGADAAPSAPASRVGGLWVSCYDGFQPSGRPGPDATRLGLLCGPVNGMTKLGRSMRGRVVQSAEKPSNHAMKAQAGGCYRVFATAGGDVHNLDVVVRSSRGSQLTRDSSDDNWPIIDPERPFCSYDDDTFRIEVSSRAGSGPYALEVWQLPPR